MQSTMTTPADELIDIEEKDIYASIRKKRNWSSPGNDKITNYWLKTLSTTHKGLAKAVSKNYQQRHTTTRLVSRREMCYDPK